MDELTFVKATYPDKIEIHAREVLRQERTGQLGDFEDGVPYLAELERKYGYDFMSAVVDRARELDPDTQL